VNRTDRLYALVEDLRASAPRPQSARRLAARYEVSARTIERDILALQESGVPVYAEPGRRGGYAIDKTMTLPPVNFTAAEMVAIAVALARDERTPFAAATRSALRKVLAVAPAAQTAQAAQLIDRVRLVGAARPGQDASVPAAVVDTVAVDTVAVDTVAVDTVAVDTVAVDTVAVDTVAAAAGGGPAHPAPEGGAVRAGTEGAVTREAMARPRSARERAASRWGGPQPGAVPLVIQDAITVGHVLRLDYRDRHDQVTVREVEPVAFVATRSQWYLLAWCRLRQGSRAFRLDRILAAVDTGAPAPPRAYQDLDVDIPDAVISRPDLHV
jgi:predicted DNA-binding transcriptional regulator YafY